eukprot:scaffold399470_cov28-Attheya_sp.AAC.1
MAKQTKSVAALTSTIATIEAKHANKLEKYKRDLSNQLKDHVTISTTEMETSADTIDAKVAD